MENIISFTINFFEDHGQLFLASFLLPCLMYFEWVPFSYRLISVAVLLEGNLVTLNHGSRITKVLGDLKPIQAKFRHGTHVPVWTSALFLWIWDLGFT